MSVVLLTPLGALVGLGIVLPLVSSLVRERRARRARTVLGLPAPSRRPRLLRAAALAAAVALVAGAAAQPAIAVTSVVRVRRDAAVYVIVDVSRSMLARRGPRGTTRFVRAVAEAEQLRAALPGVRTGLVGFTDRLVPYLLPSADAHDFDLAAEQGPQIETPPPRSSGAIGTNLDALATIVTEGYFSRWATHRAVVLFTDGESVRFDPVGVGQLLRTAKIRLFAVHTWNAAERIYDAHGRADPNYRPDPSAAAPLGALARSGGGVVYTEEDVAGLAAAVLRSLGRGPTTPLRTAEAMTQLAPYLLAAAALPLAFLLLQGRPRRRRTIAARPA